MIFKIILCFFFLIYIVFLFVKNETKFSQEYYNLIDQYKHAHKNGIKKNNQVLPKDITFDGKSLRPWIKPIRDLINLTDSKSILDYGCGKAKFYKNKISINKCDRHSIKTFKIPTGKHSIIEVSTEMRLKGDG